MPESICNLTNLIELNLSYNQLTSLPENIGNLEFLYEFRIRNNQISDLPRSLKKLWRLKHLDIRSNPIKVRTLKNQSGETLDIPFFYATKGIVGKNKKEMFWSLLENKINELNGNLANFEILNSNLYKKQFDSIILNIEYIWEEEPLDTDEVKDLIGTIKSQNLFFTDRN